MNTQIILTLLVSAISCAFINNFKNTDFPTWGELFSTIIILIVAVVLLVNIWKTKKETKCK